MRVEVSCILTSFGERFYKVSVLFDSFQTLIKVIVELPSREGLFKVTKTLHYKQKVEKV